MVKVRSGRALELVEELRRGDSPAGCRQVATDCAEVRVANVDKNAMDQQTFPEMIETQRLVLPTMWPAAS